jgi:hypothetical protein
MDVSGFDHYVAVDWSMRTMAIARLTPHGRIPVIMERPTELLGLKKYLRGLRGRKILTLEESTPAHWLYLELRDEVERIILCDPYRNRLLSDGPKNDPIDAGKLCILLRNGLLKEVFHRADRLYELRRLVSAYNDCVIAGVRLLNQHAALVRAKGGDTLPAEPTRFVLERLEEQIDLYRHTKEAYEKQFSALCAELPSLKHLVRLDGIGEIGAVKIVATVVDARRFPSVGHYHAYCGLVDHTKISGGRSYGRRKPRYSHILKSVYKTAALAAIKQKDNPFRRYYDYLRDGGLAEHHARHAVARYIAKVTYGMLKHGTPFQAFDRKGIDTKN